MNRVTQSTMEQAILFWFALIILCRCRLAETAMIAKPGCPEMCGNVTIPYPFGIGAECSIPNGYSGFQLKCNDSFTPHRITFTNDEFQIYNISDTQIHISNSVAFNCYNTSGERSQEIWASANLYQSPFSFSSGNMFTLVGCDDYARIFAMGRNRSYTFGCMSICSRASDATEGECSGVGCCQVPVPKGLRSYNISLGSFGNHTAVVQSNWCGFGFLAKQDSFRFGGLSDLQNPVPFWETVRNSTPIALDWAIGDLNCNQAQTQTDFACRDNTICVDTEVGGGGYRCECRPGFRGHPYLEPGCQDIDECLDSNLNDCAMNCNNTLGSYTCWCPEGYDGDGLRSRRGCIARPSRSNATTKIVLGTSITASALVLLLIGLTWTYLTIKKRKSILLKEKFFKQNGGLLLKQQISKYEDGVEIATRLFTIEDLEKATMNYAKENILGRGGYGTVYKGVLSDKRVVAIKKSKIVDESQIEQFINEVIILTQVKHRNVVKLFGCCLEAEVPQLVYEYISNGTLFDHIHHHRSGQVGWLTWNTRLRIAVECANALAYLHSAASIPIIHRDVKSANILIDENFTAKISDFGASRLVPIDETQVVTLVQGTFGYLDPEYFHTSQLTEKSDVYSFGVVLAELITGQKPLCMERNKEETNLASYFVKTVKENHLFRIVEPKIMREGTLDQLEAVGELIVRCLDQKSENRPTMKQVAVELENLIDSKRHPWTRHLHDNEENVLLLVGPTPHDLYYNASDSGASSSQVFSGQSISDSSTLLFNVNYPR